jgi:superfamily II DNA or RNA helicase
MRTTERNDLIRAVQLLAGVCDGAVSNDGMGYNKADAPVGATMALIPADQWPDGAAWYVWEMIATYKGQLLNTWGLDYASIPEPPRPPDVEPGRDPRLLVARLADGTYCVPHTSKGTVGTALKQVPGVVLRTEGDATYWHIPAQRARQALEIADQYGLHVASVVREAIAAEGARPDRRCVLVGDTLHLWFPKATRPVREAVKAIEGRRFHGDEAEPFWSVPVNAHTAEQVQALLETFDFSGREALAAALAEQANQVPPPPQRVELAESGDLRVVFPYHPALVAAVKRIPGRSFDRAASCWRIAFQDGTAAAMQAFLTAHPAFHYPPEVHERIIQAAAAEAQAVQARAAALAASSATDAEGLDIPGLAGTLRPFQVAGVRYMIDHHAGCLMADQMGTGKTIQTLAALEYRDDYPALIVVPSSLRLNWQREARRWLPHRSVGVLNGKKPQAGEADADIAIINYDVLAQRCAGLRASFAQRGGLRAIVLDEAHSIKNEKAARSRAALALAEGVPTRYALTGTPVVNRPVELVSILSFLGRLGEFGGFWPFVTRYCAAHKKMAGKKMVWDFSGASNLTELHQKLQATCMVRRRKEDVLVDLPPKQRVLVPVALDRAAATAYRDEAAKLVEWSQDYTDDQAAEALTRIERLKQIAARGKLAAVQAWIAEFLESGEKLIVFASHVDIQEALCAAYPDAAHILAADNVAARDAAVQRFQHDAATALVVCSLRAAGVGLTLTAASDVAFHEFGWTPADHDQAEDRAHRIGQHDSVTAWYLYAEDTIEEWILRLIERKRRVVDQATDGRDDAATASVFDDLMEAIIASGRQTSSATAEQGGL